MTTSTSTHQQRLLKLDQSIADAKAAVRAAREELAELMAQLKRRERALAKLLIKRVAEYPNQPVTRPARKPRDLICLDNTIRDTRVAIENAKKLGSEARIASSEEFLAELLADRAAVEDFALWPLAEAA